MTPADRLRVTLDAYRDHLDREHSLIGEGVCLACLEHLGQAVHDLRLAAEAAVEARINACLDRR